MIWTRIGKAAICLRVHGEAARYLVSRVGAADWSPKRPACIALWPAPEDYTGDLPIMTLAGIEAVA